MKYRWGSIGKINSDYFRIEKRKEGYDIDYYMKEINFDNYYILKTTSNFRFASKQDILDGKYAGFFFLSKKLNKKEDIQSWFDWIDGGCYKDFKYLSKPLPPVSIIEKIIILEKI